VGEKAPRRSPNVDEKMEKTTQVNLQRYDGKVSLEVKEQELENGRWDRPDECTSLGRGSPTDGPVATKEEEHSTQNEHRSFCDDQGRDQRLPTVDSVPFSSEPQSKLEFVVDGDVEGEGWSTLQEKKESNSSVSVRTSSEEEEERETAYLNAEQDQQGGGLHRSRRAVEFVSEESW
jgi:hypothetical protein